MMKSIAASLVFALLLLASSPGAASAQYADLTVELSEELPVEAWLLAYDEETTLLYVPHIKEYGELLDRAAAKCPEDRQAVGTIAIDVHRVLGADGFRVRTREVLEAIDGSYESLAAVEARGPTCTDALRRFVLSKLSDD